MGHFLNATKDQHIDPRRDMISVKADIISSHAQMQDSVAYCSDHRMFTPNKIPHRSRTSPKMCRNEVTPLFWLI